MKTGKIIAAAFAAAAFGAFADIEIAIDPAAKPIRDARQTTCASLIGYAGSLNAEKMGSIVDNDSYWYASNRMETAQAMLDAGAFQQRLWRANKWFARRHPVTDAERAEYEAKRKKGDRRARLRVQSDPKAAFELWKANGMKVLFTLECWDDGNEVENVEFVKWIVDNGYKDVVAGFELGNESFFSDKYPDLAPRWKRVIDAIWKFWPKVPLGICLCELYERNPDLKVVRDRMLAEGKIKQEGYFSIGSCNQNTTKFVVAMSNYLDRISHVVYHAYGAETPYSCSYYGFRRFRNYLEAMPELKGKKMWLTEVRPRSDEDNRCQRIFRESLIMGHYALMAVCQPDMDGFNHHELHAQSGGLYMSNGREWLIQWRDGYSWGGPSFPDRSAYRRPHLEVGSMGVVYRILAEGLRDHPLILSHGTSKEHDTEDAFYTSARVTDQVYARRDAIKEGRKPFLGLFGGVPEVEGEVEYVAALSPKKSQVCLLMVNTKGEEVSARVSVKGMQLAAPAYVAVTCPAEHIDDRAIPGEGHWWREVAWEDSQVGWPTASNWDFRDGKWVPLPPRCVPKCDELTVKIAPHTCQSVVIPMRPVPKPKGKK